MARYELDCVDCGGPHVVARKDGKYCPSCALLRTFTFLRSKYKRARKCRVCAEKFRPCKQLDLALCGGCESRQRRDHGDTPCRFCAKPVHQGAPLPNVCRCCLKDPGQQDKIVELLLKGQEQRKTKFGEVLAAQRAGTPHIRKVPDVPS